MSENEIIEQLNNLHFSKKDIPKPIFKWVGGKSQIIDKLINTFPKEFNNYHEMFLGGGSVLIALLWACKKGFITIKKKINAYDINQALISSYINIRDKKEELYLELKVIIDQFLECKIDGTLNRNPETESEALSSRESYYYWIRKQYNQLQNRTTIQASAYFIFMNKTGFRGMYREGPNGFNIPYGNYKNPKILEKKDLDYISDLIQDVNFEIRDFSESFKKVKNGDFIYLDPPYLPENATSFVGYNKEGFDIEQNKKLFLSCKKIKLPTKFIMSNSNVQLIKDFLPENEYNYEIIECRRAINSTNPAAKTKEVIIKNFE